MTICNLIYGSKRSFWMHIENGQGGSGTDLESEKLLQRCSKEMMMPWSRVVVVEVVRIRFGI